MTFEPFRWFTVHVVPFRSAALNRSEIALKQSEAA